ncbi:hypothetical protein BRARA_D00158, partial [Brassica rapa]
MNRFRKKKKPSLMEELKEMKLLEEGEMVDIPDLEIEDLIEENSLSVIVRCLNPYVYKIGGLVKPLPPIWGLEDKARKREVGENRVQFTFASEGDLQHVLTKGPWFVNGWVVSLDQWTPNPPPEFLERLTFWKQVVESLLEPLGQVGLIELHAKNSNSLEYVKAQLTINTEELLHFRRIARFKSGVTIPTELEYEKLLKICYTCKRLTHDQSRCTQQINIVQEEERAVQRRSQEQSLRKKLSEKESKAKEALQKVPAKGVVIWNAPTETISRGGKSKAHNTPKEDKRKGKRVASNPQLEWRQRSERGGPRKSRSTEESTANPRSSGDYNGVKSVNLGAEEKSTSEDPIGPRSVFHRLGSNEKEQGSGGSKEKRNARGVEGDLRLRLSGDSTVERAK